MDHLCDHHQQRDIRLAGLFQPFDAALTRALCLQDLLHLTLLGVGSVICEALHKVERALNMVGLFEPIPMTQLCLRILYSRSPNTCRTSALSIVLPIFPRNSVAATSAQ